MPNDQLPSDFQTRHLSDNRAPYTPPRKGTGPLDFAMPWVIEMRIVGTPSVLQVQVKEQMIVGRSDQAKGTRPEIDLDPFNGYYLGVSRAHAMISALNSRVSIRDINSANGTFLNGGRLEPGHEYKLHHGDQISFGKLDVQVFFVVTPSSHEKNQTDYSEVIIPTIGAGQRLLIVEDDRQVAGALGSVMAQAGFKVITADSVSEALMRIDQQAPDLVVMELILSDGNGIEVVKYLRGKADAPNTPVIVVTGATGGYQMGQAMEAGVDVFLTKPVGIDELLTGVRKVFEQA